MAVRTGWRSGLRTLRCRHRVGLCCLAGVDWTGLDWMGCLGNIIGGDEEWRKKTSTCWIKNREETRHHWPTSLHPTGHKPRKSPAFVRYQDHSALHSGDSTSAGRPSPPLHLHSGLPVNRSLKASVAHHS